MALFTRVGRLLVYDINQSFKLELFDEDALSSDDLIGVLEPKKLIQLLAGLFYKDAQSSDDLTQLLASSEKHSICELSL
eukprot:COSAG02_NODE_6781_length_3363_cov_143.625361_4_plen_79_part_00